MARSSINSPGVQITETDLSNYQQIGGPTTVFVPGFAAEGPTDEVLFISSAAELEQVYGVPGTPAERYFFYTAKEILNSPATLLTTRLPYGSGAGAGFGNKYSALVYPILTGYKDNVQTNNTGDWVLAQPTFYSLTQEEYDSIIQDNFTWTGLGSATLTPGSVFPTTSTVVTNFATSAAVFNVIQNLQPPSLDTTINFNITLSTVTFTFEVTAIATTLEGSGIYNTTNNQINGGIIILNKSQTTINEYSEGYYISIADNKGFTANSDFNAVQNMYAVNDSNQYITVQENNLGFALSGTIDTKGQNSISEAIEFIPTWNFSTPDFQDSVVVTLFKIRNSIYEPETLTYTLAESHIGSFNPKKTTNASVAGSKKFFLEDNINKSSSNLAIRINPALTTNYNWTNEVNVQNSEENKAIYSVGTFVPNYLYNTSKITGNIEQKLERALTHIETPETILVDVIVDAGLSTIFATTSGNDNIEFDDTKSFDLSNDSVQFSYWRTIFNVYNRFVTGVRKDCMFISDPLRQIFVTGTDTKTMSKRLATFATDIYGPLNETYGKVNSNYAATYGNWVKLLDSFSEKFVWVPMSGYAAAVYARTDTTNQPWFAPAGLNRGQINNIVDLAFNPNQKQRDFLYTISVNPVVLFSGDGYTIFGQKTLQNKPSAFDRVNVRRLFLTLERATQQALRYFVFEPNTEFTRTRLKNTISPIFELAKNTEGLYEYLIVCDERNNTPDVIDRNELAVDIYIKPVKAAEFILVNFIATRTGQNFQELI